MEYRALTEQETAILEEQGCTADDWTSVLVVDDFRPAYVRDVEFHGEVKLGCFERTVEVGYGFRRHSGIRHAVLADVTVGDDCLIENIGSHIYNYDLHDGCYISGVGTIETTEGATFGQGVVISVLNEAGKGNIVLFEQLTAQIADLMVREHDNDALAQSFHAMAKEAAERNVPDRGYIGCGAKITNTREISNTVVAAGCEVTGASRLSNCTVSGTGDAGSYIGHDVICENSIVTAASSVVDGARVNNCFVGESSVITSGFSAESSVFFANCYMANGEACAAFCGPFTVSHHKSSLLIGCQYSFYNAGSATNFSNHAYKLGPVHYGYLERGAKTGSGAHVLLPASIGAFSVVLGKVTLHPDTRMLPFSYIIGGESRSWLVPGRNLATVGLYRDVTKWPKRDARPREARLSAVDYEWLNPATVSAIVSGRNLLLSILSTQGQQKEYTWCGFTIKSSALKRGIELYDMALDMYLDSLLSNYGEAISQADEHNSDTTCIDLAGMLIRQSDYDDMMADVASGDISTVADLQWNLSSFGNGERRKEMAVDFFFDLLNQLGKSLNPSELHEAGIRARRHWLDAVAADADREYALGDVAEDMVERFKASLQ